MSDVDRPASVTLVDILDMAEVDAPLDRVDSDPQHIGIWVVDAVVGRSEQATVYACHNRSAPRIRAAIKVPAHGEEDVEQRFLNEARLAARFAHPHIVQVRNLVLDHRPPYLEMALVDGPDLRAVCAVGRLPVSELMHIAVGLVDAVATLEAAGVHHRDIKPGNVLVAADGPVLIDFGLAVSGDAAEAPLDGVLGSVGYLPPEWSPAAVVDGGGWDRYALGLVLFEAATGRPAFPLDPERGRLEQLVAVQAQVKQAPFLDPGAAVPAVFRELVKRLTARDPAQRQLDLKQAAADLREWSQEARSGADVSEAEGPLSAPQAAAPPRSRPWGALAVVVVAVLALVGAWAALEMHPEPGPGRVVVRLALELVPAEPGLPVALTLDGAAVDLAHPPALSPGEHRIEARVGEDCAGDPQPAWCGRVVSRVMVPEGARAHVLHTLELPDVVAREVTLEVSGTAPERVRVDSGDWVECPDGRCAVSLLPGEARRLTVQAGQCRGAPCGEECPAGCVEATGRLMVPFDGEGDLAATLSLGPLSRGTAPREGAVEASSGLGGVVTVGAFVRWLRQHPSYRAGGVDAVAQADSRYLQGWVELEPRDRLSGGQLSMTAPVDGVSPAIYAAFCAPRGGVARVDDGPAQTLGRDFELRRAGSGWVALGASGQQMPVRDGRRTLRHFVVRCRG